MAEFLLATRQRLSQSSSNQLTGGGSACPPKGELKLNEAAKCAPEQETQCLLVADNLLSLTQTESQLFTRTLGISHSKAR